SYLSNRVLNNHIENRLTDKELVAKTLGGDKRAFGLIIRYTEALVSQIVFRLVDHPEDRKDIAQEVYLKTYKKLSGFRFESKLSTWIARIAYHTCINHLERKKPVLLSHFNEGEEEENDQTDNLFFGGNTESTLNDTISVIHKKELQAILWSEIARLDPVQKMLITLFHQEELSYDEIANITQMPIGTIKNYLFRARRSLRDRLMIKYKTGDL
ncbi:MAG: RNA polymerase sigma factor, partial [Chitinophagales bacterium]